MKKCISSVEFQELSVYSTASNLFVNMQYLFQIKINSVKAKIYLSKINIKRKRVFSTNNISLKM